MIVPVEESVARSVCGPAFLALVIWREARGASVEAQIAVGYSVMNRVERPSWWGTSLDEVLGKRWQYSSMAAPNDPQLILWPRWGSASWLTALAIARAVIAKTEPNEVPTADSYHDSSIPTPATMATGTLVKEIVSPHGNSLKFWNVDHDFEAPVTGHV